MKRLFKNLFGAGSLVTAKRRTARRAMLGVESLQERLVPATLFPPTTITPVGDLTLAGPVTPNVELVKGTIKIEGSIGNDTAVLSYVSGMYRVVITSSSDPTFTGTWNFKSSDVTARTVSFTGLSGNDSFKHSESFMPVSRALRVAADGGSGNDTMSGSFKNDALDGGDGNDVINGGHGDDAINGQNGDDIIHGWVGNDVLDGGNGADHIYGESGNDLIVAGFDSVPNMVEGGYGDDSIYGANGADYLKGDDGNDYIDGQLGQDSIFGGKGDDTLLAGNDFSYNYVEGGAGNDVLYGSNGGDCLNGNSGKDWIYGLGGDDAMDGGKDFDRLFGGDGNDDINGGGDDDHTDLLYGEAGADTFHVEYKESHWWNIFGGYNPQPTGGLEVQDLNFAEGDSVVSI